MLSLKDNDRFFEILNRYKIDLLLSCGVEGMAAILKERQQNKPKEELPPYLGTTMATCLSAKYWEKMPWIGKILMLFQGLPVLGDGCGQSTAGLALHGRHR